ncbi:uncharacterized protein BDZ99DRAFT_456669 [Mytilinidion resinicola]|uniref:Uncharacterized protein n=1 Tax=Mytilinidion resinicola TaxID=574789 RepID=A0A6A6Z815_9PEZI|nr:uncharacterized protein BDZ99DRAFT_456669 [Mytilinidion resinicola]KAF2816863.1 hypothetical protein BDZ99DRAFT_456669 [Mytilinidion resinicola]
MKTSLAAPSLSRSLATGPLSRKVANMMTAKTVAMVVIKSASRRAGFTIPYKTSHSPCGFREMEEWHGGSLFHCVAVVSARLCIDP